MPSCTIRDWVDVFHVQRCVQAEARRIGFPRRAVGELAIVGSELASNILKYGVRGDIELARIDDENGVGLIVTATDAGPPFRDLAAALKDGWDDRGPIDPAEMLRRKGIGGGLGAIVRLTHSFEVQPMPHGKKIVVRRYLAIPRR